MSTNYVFTYWEGNQYAFTKICIDSITRIFGSRHIHLTPDNLSDYIDLDGNIRTCQHLPFRSDYIRTMLLEKFGGWWFDCDVLLFKNPQELINSDKSYIWNLIYRVEDHWVPLINNGILYSPKNSGWITTIAEDFRRVNTENLIMSYENEDIGQNIYENHSLNNSDVVVGCEYDFNSTFNVNADYKPFWDGRIRLNSANYGIHIGASLSRWAAATGDVTAHHILSIQSLNDLMEQFPLSVVSQYVSNHM
ncbi:capsular polysaccharide synthesis protein [Limnothrix redekei LRLZ20PSL1]|uniref:Capsular polysaccharide synthesis protein n=1 Tax=Limnothrix redekei LRLZ20PSL1 TaxID=3112953 RepID=A0ABW7C9X3_9CYAN